MKIRMRPTPNIWSILLSIESLTLMYWPKGAISPNKWVLWMYIWLFVWAHLHLLETALAFWSFLGLKDNNLSLVFSFSASRWFSFSKYFLPFSSPKMYFPNFSFRFSTPRNSGDQYAGFLFEWIFNWIESSQIKNFESILWLNYPGKRLLNNF